MKGRDRLLVVGVALIAAAAFLAGYLLVRSGSR